MTELYPVFQRDALWYFYTETWSDFLGPYITETDAQLGFQNYCTKVLHDDPNHCRAASDGECMWAHCPQLRDGEPVKSRRHCPLDEADPNE